MTTLDTAESTRRRLIGTMFAGNAMSSTGFIAMATVASLVAEDLTSSTSLAGLASTTSTLGVALGAGVLSWASLRAGRRRSFTVGYLAAVIGAAIVMLSIPTGSFPLLLVGMFTAGAGRSVDQLTRYAAGDMRTEDRRAGAISIIVWASTIGAVFGPLLIGPTSAFGLALGLDELAGPVLVGVAGFGLAGVLTAVALRPDPLSLAVADHPDVSNIARPLRDLLSSRMVQLSISAIVVSQAVMVLVMVMTPIHIRANDGSLATVGWVMMAHTLGMFAIAPVTGFLVDRLGPVRMIGAAIGTFVVACLIAAAATTASTPLLLVGLFLLGVAWNFGYVAGSTLLQVDASVPDRLRLQGFADSSAWITSAAAAGLSGVVVAWSSYGVLAVGGAMTVLVLTLPVYRARTAW